MKEGVAPQGGWKEDARKHQQFGQMENPQSTSYCAPPQAPILPNIFNVVKLEKSEDQIIIKSDPISSSDTSVFAHKKSPSNGF